MRPGLIRLNSPADASVADARSTATAGRSGAASSFDGRARRMMTPWIDVAHESEIADAGIGG
jgi:hypothetical protein